MLRKRITDKEFSKKREMLYSVVDSDFNENSLIKPPAKTSNIQKH